MKILRRLEKFQESIESISRESGLQGITAKGCRQFFRMTRNKVCPHIKPILLLLLRDKES